MRKYNERTPCRKPTTAAGRRWAKWARRGFFEPAGFPHTLPLEFLEGALRAYAAKKTGGAA